MRAIHGCVSALASGVIRYDKGLPGLKSGDPARKGAPLEEKARLAGWLADFIVPVRGPSSRTWRLAKPFLKSAVLLFVLIAASGRPCLATPGSSPAGAAPFVDEIAGKIMATSLGNWKIIPPLDISLSLSLIAVLVASGIVASWFFVPIIVGWLFRLIDPWASASTEKEDTVAEEQAFAEFAERMAKDHRWDASAPSLQTPVLPNPARRVPIVKTKQQDNLAAHFRREAPGKLADARMVFSGVAAAQTGARLKMFKALVGMLANLKDKTPQPALQPFWQMSCALEALLDRLAKKPTDVTPSALHTIAFALDMLSRLSIPGIRGDLATMPAVRVLAVDDDPVCCKALSFALQKVLSPPDLAPDGPTALTLADDVSYDAVFLDIEMPGMDGFEVCSKIHETSANSFTPVIFVTRHSDFDSRAKSSLSGGRDLIGKPFMPFEVAVKALTIILDHRLRKPLQAPTRSTKCTGQPVLV